MPVRNLSSSDNPLFRELYSLSESRQARRDTGLALLDGEHLLAEAERAGCVFRYLIAEEGANWPEPWVARHADATLVRLTASLLRKLSPVASTSGWLAVIEIPRAPVRHESRFAVLLEEVQDPGNLGGLLRTAAAAGVDAAYLSKGCADAWSPKALRGGQGAQFHLAIHDGVDLMDVARSFPGPVLAAALGGHESLFVLDLTGPVAFAFGNEGVGLGESLLSMTRAFTIPMPGGAESLNVAAAAAVCLFERVRQTAGSAA